MRFLIAYESRGGRTGAAAEAIAAEVRAAGHEADVRPLGATDAGALDQADAVFVGTWVEGFLVVGVGPARAAREWMARLPALSGKPAAVFCTYALNPRGTLPALQSALERKGARVLASRAFHRRRPAEGAGALVQQVLARLSTDP